MKKNSPAPSRIFNPRVAFYPRQFGAAIILLSVLCFADLRAEDTAPTAPASTTSISNVRALTLTSGGKAGIAYRVSHEILAHLDPDAPLAGARLARAQFPDVYSGAWGADYASFGAWLAAPSSATFGHAEFAPISRFVQNTYYTNRLLGPEDADPLEAGDRVDFFLADTFGNAPLPWDRSRGVANGTLAWDHALDAQQITASYNGVSGTADAIILRADLVARGGDVDARLNSIPAPPLVIDLPRAYLGQPQSSYIATIMYPYTAYATGLTVRVLPQEGKAILEVSGQGYLPEAKEYTVSGGSEIKEWHIPVHVIILITPDALAPMLPSVVSAKLSSGGVAVASDGAGSKQLDLPAGSTLQAGAAKPPRVLDENGKALVAPEKSVPSVPSVFAAPSSRTAGISSDAVSGDLPVVVSEIDATAGINSSLGSAVDLFIGNKSYALTLDPDYRGEGVLALHNLRRARTGTVYADAVAIPYVLVEGVPLKLTRDRLVDLRVLPTRTSDPFSLTGQNKPQPLVITEALSGVLIPFGMDIEAVYELGSDRYAFLRFEAEPRVDLSGFVKSSVVLRSLRGESFATAPVQYVELPEIGPVNLAGAVMTKEFSTPLDLHSATANTPLTIGNRIIAPTINNPETDGLLTLVRSPAALTATPFPDAAKSIDGQPLAYFYAPPAGASSRVSAVFLDIAAEKVTSLPYPGPIGEQCIAPQITDGTADAPPDLDIKQAWFDADGANLYATIQLANVPAAAPPGATYSWSLHWRNEHSGRYARATLDSSGQWTFDMGGFNARFFPLQNVTGQFRLGTDGLIRITVPRVFLGYRDGELLRDTSAHSYVNNASTDVDRAPEGTGATYGSGGTYVIGPTCLRPSRVVSRKTHGAAGAFDIDLPGAGTPGIEDRSGGKDGAHQIVFTFAAPVTAGGAAATPSAGKTAETDGLPMRSADGKEITVNLKNVSNAQTIAVGLLGVSDGTNTGNVSVPMGILLGDVNGSRRVDGSDLTSLRQQSLQPLTDASFRNDVNTSGRIDGRDGTVVAPEAEALRTLP